MSENSPSKSCPKCGAALPSAATSGLCPRCLMAEAMLPTQADTAPASGAKILTPEQLAPHFPQLEILECLGRGGMGVVYRARQKSLGRLVALKLLAPERAQDAGFAERFAREAQALAALNHPHIVTVHDFGVVDAVAPQPDCAGKDAPVPHAKMFFLLMEFVDGVNLRQAMKAGRFTPEQALAVVPPVCEALQYAHEHGIVHRDIKPENLLLDREGRVKIADFGIAKILGAPASEPAGGDSEPNPPNQSSALHEPTLASLAGTPQYMAPEQKAHRATDHRADIYSLGVVLYELLTGELPADKLQPPSRKVQIDVRLDEIVLRALEKSPELRYQTAGEFRTQVETIVSQPLGTARAEAGKPTAGDIPQREPRFSRTAIAGAGWVVLGLLAFLWLKLIEGQHVGRWRDMTGPERLGFLLTEALFISGFASTLGTTILGWISVTQIRRSAGKLHGLWLAVFDGLLFPLLALDVAIWIAFGKSWTHNPPQYGTWLGKFLVEHDYLPLLLLPVLCAVVDFLIIRAVWRAANGTVDKPRASLPSPPNTPRSILACCVAYSSGIIAAVAWMLTLSGQSAAPWDWGILIAALLGMTLAIGVQRTSCGKHALWFGGIQTLVWIFFAIFFLVYDFRGIPDLARVDSAGVVQRSPFPKAATIGRNAGTVLVVHDDVDVHYVFFAPKAVGTSDSSSHNTHSLAWLDNGAFKLTEQWTFGYLRESIDPDHLKVNGKEYDLRQGRVFLPHDDGTLEQRQLEVSLATAMDPDALAKLIANSGLGELAMRDAKVSFGPVIQQTIALGNTSNSFYSINRGGFVPGPKEFTPLPEPDNNSDEAWLIQKMLSKWMTDNDVDFIVRRNHGALVLTLVDMLTISVVAADFERRTADDLLHDPAFHELANKQLRASYTSPLTGDIHGGNKTLAFQTRYERTGMVQVVSVSNDPPSVTIRYKLVQGGAPNADAAPKSAPAYAKLSFGPVMEHDVDGAIDFDSGKVAKSLPESVTKSNDIADNILKAVAWMEHEGMDAIPEPSHLLKAVGLKAKAVDNNAWEQFSPEQTVGALADIQRELWQDLDPRHGDEPRKTPVTWVFETREGGKGILQVLTETEHGVNVRYKLVREGATSSTNETWSPTLAPGAKPDLQQILSDAQALTAGGKYEESLQRHLWFHRHALEFDPGMSAVRLSFALSYWTELARRYPKAKQALIEIRDHDASEVRAGRGYFDLFMEVKSINGYLQDEAATTDLFRQIEKSDPQLAKQCASLMNAPATATGRAPRLQFRLVAGSDDADSESVDGRDGERQFRLRREVLLDGGAIADAKVGGTDSDVAIEVTLNEAGGTRFAEISGANVGKQLAIVLDGKVLFAPTLQAAIAGGRVQILGKFTAKEAEDIAKTLAPSGSEPTKPDATKPNPIADPLPAIELKVAQQQLEKVLGDLQAVQTERALLPSKPGMSGAEQKGEAMQVERKLRVLEEQAAQLRARIQQSAKP